jgi:phosphomannomutase
MSRDDCHSRQYRCPGAEYSISHAQHLGRLAQFYPPCRACAHRDETGALPAGQVRRLREVHQRAVSAELFDAEGLTALPAEQLTPQLVQRAAAAFGLALTQGDSDKGVTVLIASDGRGLTAALTAALSEGLRWSGCAVRDVGAATAPCLSLAIAQATADGGILVSNPGAGGNVAGLKFWGPRGWPLSAGPVLAETRRLVQSGVDRPTRRYGPLARLAVDDAYLAALTPCYHALRPLRWLHQSACVPLARYLTRLTASVGCRPISCGAAAMAAEIVAQQAHFGVRIDGDGESCHVADEQGRDVPPERLLFLLARQMPLAGKTVAVEPTTPQWLADAIMTGGGNVIAGGSTRAAMAKCMADHNAVLGGGASGRLWHMVDGTPLCDALRTLTQLLVLLSRSDAPLSAVLDRDAPVAPLSQSANPCDNQTEH